MTISKFGVSASTSSLSNTNFASKAYVRTNYLESEVEEDIGMENKFKIKNVPDPIEEGDAVNKRSAVIDDGT